MFTICDPFSSILIKLILSKCDTAVRTEYVLPVTSPVSLLTQTYFHHTFCTVHTVHIVCSPFTLVVNHLLTKIAHHIFSSVLAEPQSLHFTLHFTLQSLFFPYPYFLVCTQYV